MIPILYAPSKTGTTMPAYLQEIVADENLGLGFLTDAIKCEAVEERNGVFELEMQYPVTGALYGDIQTSSWLKATPSMGGKKQIFRVYKISKPINGIVTINAEHISYMLNYAYCKPFTASGKCNVIMAAIYDNTENKTQYPFTLTVGSDKMNTETVNYELSEPENVRALLGGKEGSMLDVFGGEYEFDNLTVKLWNHRGADNGVIIKYGKNLTDIRQEISDENMLTGVYPFWRRESEDENGNTSSEYADRGKASSGNVSAVIYSQEASGNFPYYPRVISLDLSSEDKYQNRAPIYDATTPPAWSGAALYSRGTTVTRTISSVVHKYVCITDIYEDSADGTSHGKNIAPETTEGEAYWEEYESSDEFSDEALKYFNSHDISSLDVNLDVSFVDLSGTDEYKNVLPLEKVGLCDTVHVEYGDLGVQATLKVISTTYDVLEDRYSKITLGNARSNFANTVAQVEEYTEEQNRANASRYNVSDGINHLMQLISTSYGGYKIDGADWGDAGSLYFADSKNKNTAIRIVRINQNGIFFSQNGYNGPYEAGFGIDGQMVANMLTAWRLNAERLDVGFISADGTKNGNYWDLDTGEMRVMATDVGDIVEAYSSSEAYKAGDIVKYNNQQYKCKAACTGQVPTNTTYWELYAGGISLYDLLMNSSESAASAQSTANSAQSTANSAASTANSAASSAATANEGVTWLKNYENAFNTLTNNGAIPGLALVTPQQATPQLPVGLYINASYIRSGVIDTALLKVGGVSLAGDNITSQVTPGNAEYFRFTNAYEGIRVIKYPATIHVEMKWYQLKDDDPDATITYPIVSDLPNPDIFGAVIIECYNENGTPKAVVLRSVTIAGETTGTLLPKDKLTKEHAYNIVFDYIY